MFYFALFVFFPDRSFLEFPVKDVYAWTCVICPRSSSFFDLLSKTSGRMRGDFPISEVEQQSAINERKGIKKKKKKEEKGEEEEEDVTSCLFDFWRISLAVLLGILWRRSINLTALHFLPVRKGSYWHFTHQDSLDRF